MTRFQDHLSDPGYSHAIRMKLGENLRVQYDLMEPLPQSLVELLSQDQCQVDGQCGVVKGDHLIQAASVCRDFPLRPQALMALRMGPFILPGGLRGS
jgi:hypothetical protein